MPIGTYLVLALAFGLYVAMLLNVHVPAGGGEARIGNAYQVLFLTLWLWIVLAVLLIAAGMMGEMPRWVVFVAVFLLPLAGIATFTAIDMCSRHIKWAIVFPIVLPPLVAGYAVWTRFPACRAAIPAEPMSAAVWALVLVLSGTALLAASVI